MAQKVEKFSWANFAVFLFSLYFVFYLYLLYLCLKEHFYLLLFVFICFYSFFMIICHGKLCGSLHLQRLIMILRKPCDASLGPVDCCACILNETFGIYGCDLYVDNKISEICIQCKCEALNCDNWCKK